MRMKCDRGMIMDKTDAAALMAFFLVSAAALLGTISLVSSEQCESQWGKSGMTYEYGLIQGCMIKRNDGTWIPAKSYREVGK